jgi:hypothetical protein
MNKVSEGGREKIVRAAIIGITDDYMTSESHHPGYVLISAERFDRLRVAEKMLFNSTGSAEYKAIHEEPGMSHDEAADAVAKRRERIGELRYSRVATAAAVLRVEQMSRCGHMEYHRGYDRALSDIVERTVDPSVETAEMVKKAMLARMAKKIEGWDKDRSRWLQWQHDFAAAHDLLAATPTPPAGDR